MNKKGEAAFVMTFMVAVLAVLLLVYLLVPQVKNTTNSAFATQQYTHAGADFNLTLANYPILNSSLSIQNLTLNPTGNYTLLDANRGVVRFNNSAAATYTINYTYYPTNYLTSSTDRNLMTLVILAGLVGLIYWLLKVFGLA